MPGFRRAQLRGSDELFRPTEASLPEQEEIEVPVTGVSPSTATASPVPNAPHHAERSIRLSVEEIELIAEGLQQLKFPKSQARPSVDEFERLEELRKSLLDQI